MANPAENNVKNESPAQENKMGVMPVGKLLFTMSLPIMISMLVQALYNVVDSMFVARVSENALTALSMAFPIQNLMIAVSTGLGVGLNAVLSRALGAKDEKGVNRAATNGIMLLFICGLVFMLGGATIVRPYFEMQTDIAEIVESGVDYTTIVMLGSMGIFMQILFERLLQSTGRTLLTMVSQGVGAIANIILDPIFIFVFKWGMMGAAVATVIGQVFTAVLALWYLLHMKIIKPASGDYALRGSICGRMLTLGITSFLSQISLVAVMAAINNMLRKYGAMDAVFGQDQYAQIPMAVVGIVMKFFQIVISIVVGMAAGCIPIVGYNIGAENKRRVRELFTKLLVAEALVGAVALILAEGFPRQLIAIFGAANESSYYTDFAIKAFRTYLCMMVLACVNKACFIFLQAVGKALSSTLLSMFREVVFGVGFALLLPVFFGLDGVLYSMPVSDILTFIISAVIIVKTYRELHTEGVQNA